MSTDPRDLPIPDAPFDRATAFARELAYGAATGDWGVMFSVAPFRAEEQWYIMAAGDAVEKFDRFLEDRWSTTPPSADLLLALNLFQIRATSDSATHYVRTSKAISLLDAPLTPPTVFICYGRRQSSPLALLVEARLNARGAQAFIDKLIEGGAEWEALIQNTIQQKVNYFVCLIADDSLHSPNVQNEIHWAVEADKFCIPIWHGGFHAAPDQLPNDALIQSFVEKKNAIRVLEESAQAYDNAMNQLLNQLQFGV